jgi:uncharacterized low-complexity protein
VLSFTALIASGDKPFAQKDLSSGYMNEAETAKQHGTEKAKDGSCGEGKCGGKMTASVVMVDFLFGQHNPDLARRNNGMLA